MPGVLVFRLTEEVRQQLFPILIAFDVLLSCFGILTLMIGAYMRHTVPDYSDLLEGIEAESLPHSLEVHLRRDVEPAFADALADRLDNFEEVDEVATLGGWVAQAQSLLDTLRNLAVGVGLLVSLACVAIVWSTIRLGVFARRLSVIASHQSLKLWKFIDHFRNQVRLRQQARARRQVRVGVGQRRETARQIAYPRGPSALRAEPVVKRHRVEFGQTGL